jgi:alpha-amylase/alpha-mannosidase (GH57 family)
MSTPSRAVVIHGHYYQPPREDPWTGEVLHEPTAAPFHDWNERIHHECYEPIVRARIPNDEEGSLGTLNTLAWSSFDFGPTLLEWLEREKPATYEAILAADAESLRRLGGHGNALAMPYHHVILPLASRRDKQTEVRWGMADFRRRFGREPEGMWLPETAVDFETLDVLAEEGIRFTVLAPHQVEAPLPGGLPGVHRTTGGREITVFVYDGPLSHGVSFGPLTEDGELWARHIDKHIAAVGDAGPLLISLASDGETYGHHHQGGEQGLAKVLDILRHREDIRVENFAAVLARHGAPHEAKVVPASSWSCAHGVERWRSDCGCRLAPELEGQQRWRAPLREALEWLASEVHTVFEREGARLFGDPWAARDAYGASAFGTVDADGPPPTGRAHELLEMERDVLRMFTSCGWFFDDLARIEPAVVLRYAARARELAGDPEGHLLAGLLERLMEAPTNDRSYANGADFFERHILDKRGKQTSKTEDRGAP